MGFRWILISIIMSWIEYEPDCPFPIQNLPYGCFQLSSGEKHVGVAIGDQILDLTETYNAGLLSECLQSNLFTEGTLNAFMAAGRPTWVAVRNRITELLSKDNGTLRDNAEVRGKVIVAQSAVEMILPAEVGDYTDFYSSREHATNVGMMFRPGQDPLLPNWLHIPVGYHGRASSVVVSGTDLRRPHGQTVTREAPRGPPNFGPSQRVDIELEMGCFVGPGNDLGTPITLEEAEDHIFGLVLVNDWSARDIQQWEYVPLGPFLGKNFCTTISPWVVPLPALKPFRCPTPAQDDPAPLPYIKQQAGSKQGFDIKLEVGWKTAEMKAPETVVRSNLKHMYWSMPQQLVHHAVNGCNMRPGDLLATGTISGPTEGSYGSFLELTWAGSKEVKLDGGKFTRKFMADGDTVVITGHCENDDGAMLSFGECTGTLLPPVKF